MSYDLSILSRERLKRGWTMLELSRRCEMPEATVRQMFTRGSALPRTVKKVAKTLGYQLVDLLPPLESNGRKRA